MPDDDSPRFPLTVGILVFDDAEVLDVCGPYEVFSISRPIGAHAGPSDDARRLFRVLTLAAPRSPQESAPEGAAGAADEGDPRTVRCRNGLRITADLALGHDPVPDLDVLVAPGGWGTRREVGNTELIAWLRAAAPATREVIASVCTGAFLLAEAGLLDGRTVTTHWASLARLRESYPGVRVVGLVEGAPARPYGTRFVDEGRVVTSAGISAGIDMALHLVARLAGAEVARQTAEWMEYRWPGER